MLLIMINLLRRPFALFSMLNKTPIVVLYVTAGNKEEGEKIAADLVGNRLIACCNQVQGVNSIYSWEGKISNDSQVLLIMKTRESLINKIAQRVKQIHSYKLPEVIAMPVVGGSTEYINWVLANTQPDE